MKQFFLRRPKSLISSIVLWTSFFQYFSTDCCYSESSSAGSIDTSEKSVGTHSEPKYMINFNNVPVIEVIRFISKISHSNFVFEENELNFSVSVISEEPISIKNIMSALIQVLRVHDFRLLEQDGSLMITKSLTVNQIPTLILPESPETLHTDAPIVTRVFRIKNASPTSVASIIKPMTSATAQVEVSAETRQLIVTDILTNVDQISSLLVTLDTPNTRLEIESYIVKNIAPADVISLTQQILSAFVEGNPLILVPQNETNTIFIVSTPYLIDRALAVMEDVDIPSRMAIIGDKGSAQDLNIYKCVSKSPEEVLSSLQTIYNELQKDASGLSSSLLDALKEVRVIPNTKSLIFVTDPATWKKIEELLAGIDTPFDSQGLSSFWVYKIQGTDVGKLEKELYLLAGNIQNEQLSNSIRSMKWIKENNSIVFTGPPQILAQLQEIVPPLDSHSTKSRAYFIYKVENGTENSIRSGLTKMAENLQNQNLKDTIDNMKWLEESHSFVFSGPTSTIEELKNILPSLDVSSTIKDQSYVFPLDSASHTEVLRSLKSLASGLDDEQLEKTIDRAKWIEPNNTLIFTGPSNAIETLRKLLSNMDLHTVAAPKTNFLLYNPINQDGETLHKDIEQLAKNLKDAGIENSSLLRALSTVKWTESNNSLLFTGDNQTLEAIQKILVDLDKPTGPSSQIFLYAPEGISPGDLKNSLTRLEKNLKPYEDSDQKIIVAIQNSEVVPETNSLLFKTDQETFDRIKQLITTLDKNIPISQPKSFYLYKLTQASGQTVLDHLKDVAENIHSDSPANAELVQAIDNLKWIKQNNSLLINGSPQTIEQIKQLIAEFDVAKGKSEHIAEKSEFYIYKPQAQSAEELKQSLNDFAIDMEKSGLKDPEFIKTLRSLRVVESSSSVIFTGTPQSLEKLKGLLGMIDDPSGKAIPIQTIGSTTFLIYKVQKKNPADLINSLKTFGKQLSKSDIDDKALATSLNSVKWIKETNSLLFTGTENTLVKVEKVIEKFDIGANTSQQTKLGPSRGAKLASSFFIYNPRYQSGDELIQILNDFKLNLENTGVSDPGLFDTIDHLKFIAKTNSLIVSGDDASISKVQELLQKFDVLGQGATQPEISSIDDTNFLIYKLQYHKGLEIQVALKKVAASLASNEKDGSNKPLIDCINSLQWIEVTNSLLGTGDTSTLEKVKGLISNLDVPLKQVFIEVLVLETSVDNSQSFGLQWGSQLQYLNKTIGAMGNFPPSPNNVLQTPLTSTTASAPPVQGGDSISSVPFTNGFDIGVIGDIIFHKGKSFLSLGSLLNALQTDTDSTVVMNPKIMTQDGHTSNIFVGLNIPFVGSYVSNTSNNTTQTSNIEYRDVGFNLTITPTLGTNDIITLDINQDVSQVVNSDVSFSGTTVTGIETSHATMTTRIHVPDRHFLILSGMLQDTRSHSRQGLPCLGGLPMIGALFSQNDINDQKFNVIIFMKPYILHSMEDFDSITEQEETLYMDDAVLPDVKETIDSSYERIKNIE